MNILFISNYSELYGANRSLLTIINHFKSKGNNVKLILPSYGAICKELEDKNIPYQVVKIFTQLFYFKNQFKYLILPILWVITLFQFPKLLSIARNFSPDLIYSNTSAEMMGVKIAKRLNVKHLSHIREFMDLDHGALYLFGKKAKKDYINQSNAVIFVSNSVANHINLGEPLRANQKVIYNGIKCDNNNFVGHCLSQRINLGIVGIFDPEKGQDLAIRYFHKILSSYPKAILHLWGDKNGSYKNYLLNLVNSLSIKDSVIFHGFEKSQKVIYGEMDVLLMCSRCEGFGRVTVEAMSRGIPVIGYNSGGTSEIVVDGYNGYLFSSENEFIEKIDYLLKNESHYNQLCKNAYEYSRNKFSTQLYCEEVEQFVESIVK